MGWRGIGLHIPSSWGSFVVFFLFRGLFWTDAVNEFSLDLLNVQIEQFIK